jgi:hypothetical protein
MAFFYTPTQALEYLQGKVGELFRARGILQDQYGRALLLRQKSMGTANAVRAVELVKDLTTSLQDQTSLENKVRAVVPASWVPTLGIAPLVIGVGVIAVAGAVALHLSQVMKHRDTLRLVESGMITADQAIELNKSGGILGVGGLSGITGNISTIVMFGIGAYALFLFGPMLSRMVGGRK